MKAEKLAIRPWLSCRYTENALMDEPCQLCIPPFQNLVTLRQNYLPNFVYPKLIVHKRSHASMQYILICTMYRKVIGVRSGFSRSILFLVAKRQGHHHSNDQIIIQARSATHPQPQISLTESCSFMVTTPGPLFLLISVVRFSLENIF